MSEDLISALYPPPPVFYKYFTKENLDKLPEASEEDLEKSELKFLVPPSKPEGTHYRGYGNIWSFEDKLPKLEELGLEQLFPDSDDNFNKIDQLHKLVKSLLVNFIELLGILSINPQEFHDKVENLKIILININHILNSYRPHQSRESLIMLLKQQISNKNQEIKMIDEKVGEISKMMGELGERT